MNGELFLLKLKDNFYRIRQFYFGTARPGEDAEESEAPDSGSHSAVEYVGLLRELLPEAEQLPVGLQRDLLSYILRHLISALSEKEYSLAGDLSVVGISCCGIFMFPHAAPLSVYKRQILPFRREHGAEWFSEFEATFSEKKGRFPLRPCFARDRKQAALYYTPDYDGEFKAAHPLLYRLFTVICVVLLVLPIVLYFVLRAALDLPSSYWNPVGFFGAFAFGMGILSLAFSLVRQYPGHLFTAITLLGGGAATAASIIALL